MTEKKIIGIDVSKNTLDFCYLSPSGSEFLKVTNDTQGFKELNKWILKTHKLTFCNLVFCMEHTGVYNKPVLKFLHAKAASIWLESAIHIKRTMGLVRGKNDKVDAERIAKYALKHIDEMKEWKPKREVVEKIKALLTLRDNIVSQIKQLNTPLNEYKSHGDKSIAKLLEKSCKHSCRALEKDLKQIQTTIMNLINEDQSLKRLFEVLTSIPGIGPVTAWLYMVHTDEFKLFTNPRSLACHSGVAPFENSSGLFKGKRKVNHMANKKLKTALHMAAMTAVKLDPELKLYYERKVEEGKNKMSVLNAVRNKLVHRIFACQKENRLFLKKAA